MERLKAAKPIRAKQGFSEATSRSGSGDVISAPSKQFLLASDQIVARAFSCRIFQVWEAKAMASNLRAMASNLIAMASNLLEIGSNLMALASNRIAM